MSIKREVAKYLVIILMVIAFFEALKVVTGTSVPLAVVEGNSMYPTLHDGDVVLLVGAKPSDLKVGDIIVYKSGGKYIIHKIISIEIRNGKYYFITQGENNPLPDRPVPEDSVVGRVVFRIPLIGVILQEPFKYIIISLLIAIFIALIVRSPTRKKEESSCNEIKEKLCG